MAKYNTAYCYIVHSSCSNWMLLLEWLLHSINMTPANIWQQHFTVMSEHFQHIKTYHNKHVIPHTSTSVRSSPYSMSGCSPVTHHTVNSQYIAVVYLHSTTNRQFIVHQGAVYYILCWTSLLPLWDLGCTFVWPWFYPRLTSVLLLTSVRLSDPCLTFVLMGWCKEDVTSVR